MVKNKPLRKVSRRVNSEKTSENNNFQFSKKSYLKNIKELFFKSDSFLDKISTEIRYQVFMKDYTLIYLLYFIISLLAGIAFQIPTIQEILMGFIITVVSAVIVPFAVAGIIHLGVLAFKGKGMFIDTYKLGVYALTILTVYSMIMVILQLIFWFIFPYDMGILGQLRNTQDPDLIASLATAFLSQPGAKVSIAIYLLINIVSIIHGFIFFTKGINKFHNIKRGKAVLAILLPIIVLFVLAVLIILLLSMGASISA
ncbi:MAG: YIP1 family protein [Nanoarchaeota archaeon]